MEEINPKAPSTRLRLSLAGTVHFKLNLTISGALVPVDLRGSHWPQWVRPREELWDIAGIAGLGRGGMASLRLFTTPAYPRERNTYTTDYLTWSLPSHVQLGKKREILYCLYDDLVSQNMLPTVWILGAV